MLKFRRNMGNLDRSIRIMVGIALWVVGPATNLVVLDEVLEITLAVIGTFAILSALFAYCVLYEFTGSDTKA
ncbi:MAG: DUF2892 domain-containing protein [Gammaproteobacteria bacterium]